MHDGQALGTSNAWELQRAWVVIVLAQGDATAVASHSGLVSTAGNAASPQATTPDAASSCSA